MDKLIDVLKVNNNTEALRFGKSRTTVTANALGDYFGVGFMEPMERLAQDLGLVEPKPFFQAVKDAMDLGNAMEDAVLDYWEKQFDTSIYERNVNTKTALDGKLRVRKDGHMILNGDEEVVESKYVNSGASFINDKGYHIQVYAQILAEQDEGKDVRHGRLLGMYKGRPQQIRLTLTDEIKEDMLEMINAVTDILVANEEEYKKSGKSIDPGVADFMFPWHLVEKYSGADLRPSEEYDEDDDDIMNEFAQIKAQQKELNTREKEIKEYLNAKYDVMEELVLDDGYKFTIREQQRKGAIDMDMIQTDYPELDFEKYRKEPSKYSVLTIRELKN